MNVVSEGKTQNVCGWQQSQFVGQHGPMDGGIGGMGGMITLFAGEFFGMKYL